MQPLTHHSHRLQVNNPLPDLWHLLKQVSTSPPFQPPRRCSTLLMMVALGSPSSSTAYALVPLSWLQYFWWLQLPHLAFHLSIHHPSALPPPTTVQLWRHDHLGLPHFLNLNQEFTVLTIILGRTFPLFHLLQSPCPFVPPDAFMPPDSTELLIWTPLPPTMTGNSLWSTTPMVYSVSPQTPSLLYLLSPFFVFDCHERLEAKFSESILNSATHLHPFILLKYQLHF